MNDVFGLFHDEKFHHVEFARFPSFFHVVGQLSLRQIVPENP